MKRLIIAVFIFLCIIPFTPYVKKYYWSKTDLQKHSQTRLENRRFDEIKTQTGVVTGIPNENSIIIKMDNEEYVEIPLIGIRFSNNECEIRKAREQLISFVKDSVVSIEKLDDDSCCVIRKKEQDISMWMIWNGFARADKSIQFSKLNEYTSHQNNAKNAKRGLWAGECED